MAKREVVALNEGTPQLEAAQSGDTYQFPRDIFSSTGVVTSEVADGAAAVAFDFVSPAYVTGGAKLVSVKNDVTEALSVDKDGNVALTGTVDGRDIAADGATLDAVGFTTDVDTQITPATAIVLDHATNPEIALDLEYTVNKAGGAASGLVINTIETSVPSTNYPFEVKSGGVSGMYVTSDGHYEAGNANGPSIRNVGAGAVSILPNKLDTNTGLQVTVGDRLEVLAGGRTAIKMTESGVWCFTELNSDSVSSLTSGQVTSVAIKPAYNQASGTAANTDLLINRTETAVGSGAQLLTDWQVGGVSQASIDNAGQLWLDKAQTYGSSSGILFGDGDTYIAELSDDSLAFAVLGGVKFGIGSSGHSYIIAGRRFYYGGDNTGTYLRESGGKLEAGGGQFKALNGIDFTNATASTGYTVATLPTPAVGMIARITDGDAGLAWGATAVNTGAGATPYVVCYLGTNWTIMGK